METFVFNDAFESALQHDPHHYGEVFFLQSVLRPGMTVVEGGAHAGVTAVAIAKAIGPHGALYAFEPVPEYFASLQANFDANHTVNATALQFALGHTEGRIPFYRHGDGSGVTPATGAEKIEVNATTLANVVAAQALSGLDFIHLDCEGSEMAILDSARSVLELHSPGILCEVHREYLGVLGYTVDDVAGLLEGMHYQVEPITIEAKGAPSTIELCSHLYAHRGRPDRKA